MAFVTARPPFIWALGRRWKQGRRARVRKPPADGQAGRLAGCGPARGSMSSPPPSRPGLTGLADGWPGVSSVSGRAGPSLNKDLFLPGCALGLATAGSMSSSERPAAHPAVGPRHPVESSQCGPVLPPHGRQLPGPAGGGGCWFSGRCMHCVWPETGHLFAGSPFGLRGDLLWAKHVQQAGPLLSQPALGLFLRSAWAASFLSLRAGLAPPWTGLCHRWWLGSVSWPR